jgi:hypothetical protein
MLDSDATSAMPLQKPPPPPKEPFYMVVDEQVRDWWENCLGKPPIPRGWVIPILSNLQGHPEAPRLWHKHIDGILIPTITHTTHEACLYYKHHSTLGLILLLRQVDDFIIGAKTMELSLIIKQQIQDNKVNLLSELGIIKCFIGLDIEYTSHYIKISAQTYINKIVEHHGWQLEKLPIYHSPCATTPHIKLHSNYPMAQKMSKKSVNLKPKWDSAIARPLENSSSP